MKVKLLLATLLLLAVLATGMTLTTAAPTTRVHVMEADYPLYAGVQDLATAATLIVQGTALEHHPAQRVLPAGIPLGEMPTEKAEHVGFLVTEISMRVDRVLQGQPDLAGTTIRVAHLGGTQGADQYLMESEPLSQVGHGYLLFLQEVGPGQYVIVGGNQGRYALRNGRAQALTDEARSQPVVQLLHNADLGQVQRQLQAAGRAERPAPATRAEEQEGLRTEQLPSGPEKPLGPPTD